MKQLTRCIALLLLVGATAATADTDEHNDTYWEFMLHDNIESGMCDKESERLGFATVCSTEYYEMCMERDPVQSMQYFETADDYVSTCKRKTNNCPSGYMLDCIGHMM